MKTDIEDRIERTMSEALDNVSKAAFRAGQEKMRNMVLDKLQRCNNAEPHETTCAHGKFYYQECSLCIEDNIRNIPIRDMTK